MPGKKPRAKAKAAAKPKPAVPKKKPAAAPATKRAPGAKAAPKKPKETGPPKHIAQRIHDIRQAVARPARSLSTFPSAEAARLRGQEGLVQLPYLTVNDLLALRRAGFKDVEDLERRWADIPEEAWRSVVYLVEARVLRLPTELPKEFPPHAG